MVRAAIVGLGAWGRILVRSVHGKSDRIRFTRAVTRTPDAAADFSRQTGIPVDADWTALLADGDIDAVVLATPHSQHVEQAVAAAAAGKHVFVEKPLALSASEARQAVSACEATGRVLAVGQNRRFLPAFQRLSEIVGGGELGVLLHIEGNFSGPSGYRRKPGSWRSEPHESPSGSMTGKGVHMTDLMIALFGAVEEVDARSLQLVLQEDVDDTTSMLLRFAAGNTGYLGTINATADMWHLRVFGSKGWAEMRGPDRLAVRLIDRGAETVQEFAPRDIERAELEAFADAVEEKAPFPVTPEQALMNAAVLQAVGRSVENERPCPVAEFLE